MHNRKRVEASAPPPLAATRSTMARPSKPPVRVHSGSHRQGCEQIGKWGLVGRLPGGDQSPRRQAVLIDHRIDFGAQSAARTANGSDCAPNRDPVS